MASAYLSRTPSSAGNRDTFTASFWVKRGAIGSTQRLWNAGTSIGTNNDNVSSLLFESNDTLKFFGEIGGSASFTLQTTQLFRDTSAWYHIVLEVDTTQATASDRVKIYVNGEQITDFGTETYMSQNTDTFFNATNLHVISYVGSGYFDGSMTHFHFIDGTAYDADTFGETDSTTGIWKPKTAPSVTYGTNGFFLKMENSGAMGTDSSGNSNTYTVNGTITQTLDTPSNVFATFNSLDKASSVTLTLGNTKAVCATANSRSVNTTLAVSKGKYYAEIKYDSGTAAVIGVVSTKFLAIQNTAKAHQYSGSGGGVFYLQGNHIYIDGVDTSDAATYTTGDIIGIALNLDDDEITFYKNGTSQGVITSKTFDDDGYFFAVSHASGSGSSTYLANFGNGVFGTTAVSSAQNPDDGIGIFEYDVPAGYRALCTKSINAEEYS